jgi:uncharacterized heparinase superfamily protein
MRIWVRGKRQCLKSIPFAEFFYPDHPKNSVIPLHTKKGLLPGLEGLLSVGQNPNLNAAAQIAGKMLRDRRFSFVGEESQYDNYVNWNDSDRIRLWRLNLHYFDSAPLWILDAAVNGNKENIVHWKWLVNSWIENNPIGCFEAWNPYCLSRRIPNWILAYQLAFNSSFDDINFSKTYIKSLYRQSAYLYGNVEWDLPMNHLTSNGRGLFYAGIFFGGEAGHKWIARGLRLIWERLENDVCSDGGHAERSPMYHLIVLQDSLECLVISQRFGIDWPKKHTDTLKKMVQFAYAIEHPDGEIPLFNDSACGIAVRSRELVSVADRILNPANKVLSGKELSKKTFWGEALLPEGVISTKMRPAKENQLTEFPDSGYYVIFNENKGYKVIFDCGEPGIREVASHAHSDLLSYEMSFNGQRIVVDTGTSSYASGLRRNFERSIFAHNTISVDGLDTCEPWSDYRMARRGTPGVVKTFAQNSIIIIDAGHSSFLQRAGLTHRRAVVKFKENLLVLDKLKGVGSHNIYGTLNIHPKISITPIESSISSFKIHNEVAKLKLYFFGVDAFLSKAGDNGMAGWYAPKFGQLVAMKVLNVKCKKEFPTLFGHLFVEENSNLKCEENDNGWNLIVETDHLQWELFINNKEIKLKKPNYVIYEWI